MQTNLLGSASKLERTMKCPASGLLPQVREVSERTKKAGARGTAIHRYLELAPEGVDAALAEIPQQYHRYCSQIDMTQVAGTSTPRHHRELAFAYDIETGTARELECEDRNYGELKPTEVPGTADVVIAGFRSAEVWDYKTGKTPVAEPGVNAQLLHLATCVVRTLARAASIVVVGVQYLRGYGRVEPKCATVDLFDIEAHEERLRASLSVAERVAAQIKAGATPDVFPGEHCLYCPAEPVCPAKGESK